MKITFALADRDLRHIRERLRKAQVPKDEAGERAVLRAVEALAHRIHTAKSPDFVIERLECLECMVEMTRDPDWPLPPSVRPRVMKALCYFAAPEDMIPDETPVFGFLDDAIMIELVHMELEHEIKAYQDFREYRRMERPRARSRPQLELRLQARRKKLRVRIQDRINRDNDRARKAGQRRFRLFS